MNDLIPAMVANEARAQSDDFTSADRLLEAMRLTVRQAQLDLMREPDPSSPWWFLVDPDTFTA